MEWRNEKTVDEWTVKCARGFFVIMALFTSVLCFVAAGKLSGVLPRFQVAAVWIFPVAIGVNLWKAPSRGQMAEALSVSLLMSVATLLMVIGWLLDYLTHKL